MFTNCNKMYKKKLQGSIYLESYKTIEWKKRDVFWPGLSETTYGVKSKKASERF